MYILFLNGKKKRPTKKSNAAQHSLKNHPLFFLLLRNASAAWKCNRRLGKKKKENPRTRLGYRSNALHTPVIWEKGEEGGGNRKKKKHVL